MVAQTSRYLGMTVGLRWTTLAVLVLASCSAQPPNPIVTKLRIPPDGGPLYATIGGKEKKIAASAGKAWILEGGRALAYSTSAGGGFEGEGEALRLYRPATAQDTKILGEPFEITGVKEVRSAAGKPAFLVTMEDGGLGASHIAVIDPARGKVFREDGAVFKESAAGAVTVAWYKDDAWENIASAKPYKTQRYDLDELLRRNVITK
jgi:hypothetical protein